MSRLRGYEHVPPAGARPLSAVSDISQPESQDARSYARKSISPIPSPAFSYNRDHSHLQIKEKHGDRVSLRSFKGARSATDFHDATWLPVTLRWYLVWLPATVALISGIVIMMLWWYSQKNNGLSPATSAIFGWKFAPTLIAVVYTQLTTILFDDVKRTEPFARLARPQGSVPSASRTILETPRAWWVTLVHGFQKKHNGGQRSWILVLTCLINVLAFLGISPLSSALLAVDDILITRPVELSRLMTKQDSVLKPFKDRDMFFRTTAAWLQNVTTSPWVSDEYAVLPFWPVEVSSSPWSAQTLQAPRTWRAETVVFRADLKCTRLELAKTGFYNVTFPDDDESSMMASVRLDSSDGCQYNISSSLSDASQRDSFITWSPADRFVDQDEFRGELLQQEVHPTSNDKCRGDEAIILGTKWLNYNMSLPVESTKFFSNITTWGHMCSTSLSMATMAVVASVSDTSFGIDFDQQEFRRTQTPVPDSLLKHSDLLPIYTNPEWFQYVPTSGLLMRTSQFSGIAALLAAQYGLNATDMAQAVDLTEQAARLRRRHFGELLRSSLDAPGAAQIESVSGDVAARERRVKVSTEAAALLAGLFFVSFSMLLYVTWFSRIAQRPLNLIHDPGTVVGTASLVAHSKADLADVISTLRGLDQATAQELKASLGGNVYYTTPSGQLRADVTQKQLGVVDLSSKNHAKIPQRSPFFLKIGTLLGLLLYLVALLTALAVVHRFATKSGLRQALFTYRVKSDAFGSFAPFSIIPTVLGIAVGLWWNGMDKSFRSLQPYVSMSKAPVELRRGAGVSYQSTHWLLATSRAAKNKHWLLSLVTFGTFLAQAFIITMSALFELNTGIVDSQVTLNRSLELRQMPHVRLEKAVYPFEVRDGEGAYGFAGVASTLQELFTNLTTNWMYSAAIQATLEGSEPAWSKDGWSFVPVDLSAADDMKETYHKNNDSETDANFNNYSPVNITMNTPAIRAQLECTPTGDVSNTSWWLDPYNETDPTTNKTRKVYNTRYTWSFELPTVNYSTLLAPDAQIPQCCYNQTDPVLVKDWTMPIAFGYWTANYGERDGVLPVTGDTGNFTVKWIHGEAGFPNRYAGSRPPAMYTKEPKLQALNCMPIIEKVEAKISVDKQTGRIQSYDILGEPVPDDSAWTDSFVFHKVTSPDDPEFKAELASSPVSGYDTEHVYARQNMTSSYGVLFTNSVIRASRLRSLDRPMGARGSMIDEDLTDNVFNIRNNETGLNLDFLSYASYVRAGKDAQSLTEYDTLLRHTQDTFATFFQHYVSSNYSLTSGGWAYQPIGANLNDLGDVAKGTVRQVAPDGKPAVKFQDLPVQNTEPTAIATMSTRVEVLDMNKNAFWLCLAILIWLCITVLIVAGTHKWDIGKLGHDVESIADTLVLVAGSDRLLAAIRQQGVEGLRGGNVKTRLGWFRDRDGKMRRGIEIVEEGEVLIQ